MALAEIDVTPDALPLDSIICGDALAVLRTLPDNSVDAIVTDPPAGISFMGKGWDSNKGGRDAWIAWLAEILREAWRVTKPGGHALVWALPRTSHWTAMALEDAGWEIRDRLAHITGQGFPKSLDVSKQLDKMAGAKRGVVGVRDTLTGRDKSRNTFMASPRIMDITAPATDAAREWDGWGTALKPAVEDWWLCRKPLSEKSVAANVLRWGTGALNIGASRVGVADDEPNKRRATGQQGGAVSLFGVGNHQRDATLTAGRWPANLLLSHAPDCTAGGCSLWCPIRTLDAQGGYRKSGATLPHHNSHFGGTFGNGKKVTSTVTANEGYVSRYFTTFRYTAKASRSERNRGCEALPERIGGTMNGGHMTSDGRTAEWGGRIPATNHHPCVKPQMLMSWLIGLITPPGGIVLDPFAGSGSTLCAAKTGGWRYIGIEKEAEYVTIARARVQAS